VHSEESEFTRSCKNYQEIVFLYCFDMHECNFVVRLGRLINFLSLFFNQTLYLLLGELAATHKQTLLNAYLTGAKDSEASHRASSLSNLGEACKILGYKMSSDLQEVKH
jgi:hypothetical protein